MASTRCSSMERLSRGAHAAPHDALPTPVPGGQFSPNPLRRLTTSLSEAIAAEMMPEGLRAIFAPSSRHLHVVFPAGFSQVGRADGLNSCELDRGLPRLRWFL